MGMPPLMVTGRTGAFGKTKRQARSPAPHELRDDGLEIMAVGAQAVQPDHGGIRLCGAVSTSMVSSIGDNVPGNQRQLDRLEYHRGMPVTFDHLRRYAIARSLFKPTTLKRAIDKLGFVQADPIRAPARAQDLTLRHRVRGLSRRRSGAPLSASCRSRRISSSTTAFCRGRIMQLMHPRTARTVWTAARAEQAAAVLAFVRERGAVHPREVDAHFAHGKVTNWFGGSSNASTQLLDVMHYRGLLRVARREGGTRVYAARAPRCRERRGRPAGLGLGAVHAWTRWWT